MIDTTLYKAKSYDDLQQQLGMMKLIVHEFIYPYGVQPELLTENPDPYTIDIQVISFWDGIHYRVLEEGRRLRRKMAEFPALFHSFEAHDRTYLLIHMLETKQWYIQCVITEPELLELFQQQFRKTWDKNGGGEIV